MIEARRRDGQACSDVNGLNGSFEAGRWGRNPMLSGKEPA